METTNPTRRNLSGVYIFDTLPGDDRRQPTCIEDCTAEKREQWLTSLDDEALRRLNSQLVEVLVRAVEMVSENPDEPRTRKMINDNLLDKYGKGVKCDLLDDAEYLCQKIRHLADEFGIVAGGEEVDNDNKKEETANEN